MTFRPLAADELTEAIAKAALDAILIIDDEDRLVYANPAFEAMLGHDPATLYGERIHDRIAPERYRAAFRQGMRHFREHGEGPVVGTMTELEALHQHGHEIAVELSISRLALHGRWYAVGVLRDITERKQAEDELKRARDQFQSLTENIPGLSYHCQFDEHWTALYVSEGAEQVTGYPAEEFIHNSVRTLQSLVHPDDTGYVADRINTSVAQKRGWDIDYRILHRDGKVRWVHEKGRAIFEHDGSVAYLDGFVHDITRRRRQAAFQEMVATISVDIVNAPMEDTKEAIHRALERIGRFFEADRTYVFEFQEDGRLMDNTHEWCAQGVIPQAGRISEVPLEAYSWCIEKIHRQEPVHVPDVEALPPEAANELAEFRAQSIQSLLMLPLATDGRVFGFYGLDVVHTTHHWNDDEINLLQVVAEIFVSTLARRQAEQTRQAQARLQAMVAEISAEMVNLGGEGLDSAIDRALERTGLFFGADRSYVFHFDDHDTTMSNTNEWCGVGVTPHRETLQSIPVDSHKGVTEPILQGETVHLPDITVLPEGLTERAELERQGVQSLLCLPLFIEQRPYGFLGYDMVARRRKWTDAQITVLKLIAEIIAGAFARLESEMALRRSEMKHRILFEATSDAVMLLDETGFLDCNQSTLKMFGCASREEFIDKHPAELSPPVQPCGTDSHSLADEHIRTAMDQGSHLFEWQHRRMDSEIFAAEVLLTAMNMEDRQLLQAVVRDISDRKRAQEELKRQRDHLDRLSSIDGLTGVANRRRFDEALEQTWKQTVRNGNSLGLLMLDIDHFKRYNDHYGHLAGDDVLKGVAETISGALPRTTDLVARYGGEEFVCILPATDLDGARKVAERIRAAVRSLAIPHETTGTGRVTVSIGATALRQPTPEMSGPLELLKTADQALYRAKEQGRDRVVTMSSQNP